MDEYGNELHVETLTCSACGREQTAPTIDARAWRGWRVLLDHEGQFPPTGYLCPECSKSN